MITLFILLCIYSSLVGSKEAILYAKQGAETFKWNEHILFRFQDVIVYTILISLYLLNITMSECIFSIVSAIFAFPFFHNGFYYETARKINRPDYRFWSNSETSTAKIEIDWTFRCIFLGFGIGIICVQLLS